MTGIGPTELIVLGVILGAIALGFVLWKVMGG